MLSFVVLFWDVSSEFCIITCYRCCSVLGCKFRVPVPFWDVSSEFCFITCYRLLFCFGM
jgi:hypothetical protein